MKKTFIICLIAIVAVIIIVIVKTQFKLEGKYNLPTNPSNPTLIPARKEYMYMVRTTHQTIRDIADTVM
jgi:uncharacterized alpha/beta hydrolase family protein